MNELQKIANIFQSNLGNRITVELANGMIQEIAKILPQTTERSDDKTNKVADKPV
jgi:hypothetical protein